MLKSPPDVITPVMDIWNDTPDTPDSPLPKAWKAGPGFAVSNGFDRNREQSETLWAARLLLIAPACCFLLVMLAVVLYAWSCRHGG